MWYQKASHTGEASKFRIKLVSSKSLGTKVLKYKNDLLFHHRAILVRASPAALLGWHCPVCLGLRVPGMWDFQC